ncbi:hypothetical protein D9C73_028396 [Collichthys lucidus]|uniref:Integrase catalytic domain-containing protein n=1 Tax=Collichthys lucidus TaxID=240159 RepID=A0A4U5TVI6_COLLU|nr:hypothetical protein D9C73_028396 [Collichthys lucidus]
MPDPRQQFVVEVDATNEVKLKLHVQIRCGLDRGAQFISCFWRNFCRLIGATVSPTSGYHPEANGQTERLNQQLETGLRCLVSQNPSTWSKHLTWSLKCRCLLPTPWTAVADESGQPPGSSLSARETGSKGLRTGEDDPLRRTSRARVFGSQPRTLHLKALSKKLALRFIGPFPITKVIGPAAVRLRLLQSLRVHPTFHVSQVKLVKENPMVPPLPPPPPPEVVDGGPVYKVKKLLAVCTQGPGQAVPGGLGGVRSGGATMGSFTAHHGPQSDFYRDHPDQPGPSGVGPRGRGTVTLR